MEGIHTGPGIAESKEIIGKQVAQTSTSPNSAFPLVKTYSQIGKWNFPIISIIK
jgi:hypothetical protein